MNRPQALREITYRSLCYNNQQRKLLNTCKALPCWACVEQLFTDTGGAGQCWSLIDFSGKNIQQSQSVHVPSLQRTGVWSEVVMIALFYILMEKDELSEGLRISWTWLSGGKGLVSGIVMSGDSLHFSEVWFSYQLGMMVLLSLLQLKSAMDRSIIPVKLSIGKVKAYLMWGDICNIYKLRKTHL